MKFVILGVVTIVISIIILGFVVGLILPETNKGCTERGCSCENVSGEISCNFCRFSDPMFVSGIFNVVKECKATQVITCENGTQIDSSFRDKECEINWYILGVHSRYFGIDFSNSKKMIGKNLGKS